MFLLDDLLLAPGKAALFLFEELARKAREDWLDDDAVKQELQEIYALLDAGGISTQEFENRESYLLTRLEQIANARSPGIGAGENEAVAIQPPVEIIEPPPSHPEPQVSIVTVVRRLLESVRPIVEPALPVVSPVEEHDRAEREAARDRENLEQVMRWREEKRAVQPPPRVMAQLPPADPSPPPGPSPHAAAAFERQSVPITGSLTMSQVIDSAVRGLSMLKLKVSTVCSVVRDEAGWRVTAELVERRSVPDTSDLLGVYELRLDELGNILRYERTRMRRRFDIGRS
jgi:hypothetical protein